MLINLIVFVIVVGLLYWLTTLLPLPEPFKTILLVLVILLCIVWLLDFTGMMGGPLFHPLTR